MAKRWKKRSPRPDPVLGLCAGADHMQSFATLRGIPVSRHVLAGLLAGALLALAPTRAHAVVHFGDTAPDFHKVDLNGTSQTLFQYHGKVVFMFLEGWF